MNIKRIYFRILSIINILFINIDIIFHKILKKKIIVFFHPKGNLKSISDYYINPLFKSKYKNHKVYILENSSNFFLSNTLIEESFVKYLVGIDVFFNNYLCDTFPNNCKKIYIHHDIYDTPIANRKVYKEIRNRLIKYDYILLPSIKSKTIFDDLSIDYIQKNIQFEYIGYYKLDLLKNKKNIKKKDSNKIVIAPTNFLSFPNMSLYKNIYKIIDSIFKYSNFDVIFRPHPSNFESSKVKSIAKKYKKNQRFFLDTSKNYFEIYKDSCCLISDLSGTAYTYSLLIEKPVIFYSNYEKKLKALNYHKLNYFKDREKVGYVVNNVKYLINIINNNKKQFTKLKKKQKKLKKIFHIGFTKQRFEKFLNKIL